MQTRLHGDDYREIPRESAYSSAAFAVNAISYTCINPADALMHADEGEKSWRILAKYISWKSTRILFAAMGFLSVFFLPLIFESMKYCHEREHLKFEIVIAFVFILYLDELSIYYALSSFKAILAILSLFLIFSLSFLFY